MVRIGLSHDSAFAAPYRTSFADTEHMSCAFVRAPVPEQGNCLSLRWKYPGPLKIVLCHLSFSSAETECHCKIDSLRDRCLCAVAPTMLREAINIVQGTAVNESTTFAYLFQDLICDDRYKGLNDSSFPPSVSFTIVTSLE